MRVALVAGWALLALAWAIANPPFAAPDEASHYVRALGVGQGHAIGRATNVPVGGTPRQQEWVRQLVRAVDVPAGLDPRPFDCVRRAHDSAACQTNARPSATRTSAITDVGPYQPLPYVAPGLAARLGSRATGADRLARGASLAITLALLASAALLARASVLGLALAVTPMVLFLGASVTSSGFEVAAGVAFAAAVLRAARAETSRRERLLLAVTGAALALSRTPGPLWVAVDLAIGAALVGPRTFARRAGTPALAAIAGAIVLNRVWEALHGPSAGLDLHGGAGESVRQAYHAIPQLVGRFGYLEWRLPVWIPLLWLALVAALVIVALRGGARRGVLTATVAGAIALPPLFWLLVLRPTGFALQGRHILPALVALPLLAGELAPPARRLARVAAVGVAFVQFAAFALDARRAATGTDGPLIFLGKAEWSPPGGWLVWLLIAAAGAVLAGLAIDVAGRQAPTDARRGSTLVPLPRRFLPSNQELL